jgi:hypothetical protein
MANTYTDLLKLRKPALGDVGWDDEVNDNTEIAEFVLSSVLKSNVVIDGLVPSDGGGLDVDVTAGNVVVGGAAYAVGSGSKTCTSGVKNWLYVDDAGALQVATTAPTGNYVALALIDAGSTTLTRIADARNFAEGALTIGVTHTPDNYAADTSKTGAINQHLAGIDTQLGFMGGFKNKLINGGFDIWQRGTSQTSSGYGSDDRWKNTHIGSTKTHSRQVFTVGQTDVPGNPKYYSRTVVTTASGASDYVRSESRIEGVKTFAGQTCTLSFWAKADSSKNIAVEFYQYFGSGGSPSANVTAIGATTRAATSSWQQFSVTVDIPSINGKTLGSDNNDFFSVFFWFDAGSDYDSRTNSLGNQSGTFDLAQVQLEAGEVATPFEQRPIGVELALCQRYYQVFGNFANSATAEYICCDVTNGATYWKTVRFRVTMRTVPTSVNLTYGSDAIFNQSSASVSVLSADSFRLQVTANGSGAGYIYFHWTAEAEL